MGGENKFKQAILEALKVRGKKDKKLVWWALIETPTVSGVPDVILGCNGCLRFIEFKAGTELRPEQKIQSVIIKMTSVPVLLVDKKSPNSFMIGEINYDLFENTLTFDNQTLVNSFEECVEEVWKRLT